MENKIQLTELAHDVLKGLTSAPKFLNSKYFYNSRGSLIFQRIMQMPEYYLTGCETEIFNKQKHSIYHAFAGPEGEPFDLIELGAGDGKKTRVLLKYFVSKNNNHSTYFPVDISEDAVMNLIQDLEIDLPELEVRGKVGDYFKLMDELSRLEQRRKILLFLGSNIGNFNLDRSVSFLKQLHDVMNRNDKLFIGFDLKKDPEVILKAYNDPHGYTSSFNLNLLRRINEELDADFELLQFKHHEIYDPYTGTARSFLVSRKEQDVRIEALEKTIRFEKWEPIFMEMSQKYDEPMIRNLAASSGFEIERNFTDSKNYFLNSLWKLRN